MRLLDFKNLLIFLIYIVEFLHTENLKLKLKTLQKLNFIYFFKIQPTKYQHTNPQNHKNSMVLLNIDILINKHNMTKSIKELMQKLMEHYFENAAYVTDKKKLFQNFYRRKYANC